MNKIYVIYLDITRGDRTHQEVVLMTLPTGGDLKTYIQALIINYDSPTTEIVENHISYNHDGSISQFLFSVYIDGGECRITLSDYREVSEEKAKIYSEIINYIHVTDEEISAAQAFKGDNDFFLKQLRGRDEDEDEEEWGVG